VKPWATDHALYCETFPNLHRFLTNTHLQPIGLTPFGVVSNELNTFRDIKDPSLDLIAFSHMGQSLRLRALATVVGSQSSSKCCDIWKQKASSRFTNVRSHTFHVFTKLIAMYVESNGVALSKSFSSMRGSTPPHVVRTSHWVRSLRG
jgi:hypothetical protein